MHRAVRVGEYWNWLPAFRAVAETASLRDAAERIHVAPSAISRTIRQLEDSLGYPLFERTSGSLVLNAAGRQLLDAVRTAMRTVNEAQAGQNAHDGPCHIYCPLDVVPLLLDALEAWATAHPQSPPMVHVPCAEDIGAQLLRGDLDVAIGFEHATQAGIVSAPLGELSSSIYCAPSHPARQLESISDGDLARLPFIDYHVGELTFLRIMRDRERQSVAYMPTMDLAVQLSTRGLGVVCVPDFVAEAKAPRLVRLPYELPRARLFVWYRRPVNDRRPAIVELLANQACFSALVSGRLQRSPRSNKRLRSVSGH